MSCAKLGISCSKLSLPFTTISFGLLLPIQLVRVEVSEFYFSAQQQFIFVLHWFIHALQCLTCALQKFCFGKTIKPKIY